jgi:hypothetical protein
MVYGAYEIVHDTPDNPSLISMLSQEVVHFFHGRNRHVEKKRCHTLHTAQNAAGRAGRRKRMVGGRNGKVKEGREQMPGAALG